MLCSKCGINPVGDVCLGCSYERQTHTGVNWAELMNFIVNNRPIVVHNLWIDTFPFLTNSYYRMSYSLVRSRAKHDVSDVVPAEIESS